MAFGEVKGGTDIFVVEEHMTISGEHEEYVIHDYQGRDFLFPKEDKV
jgi:hypothetical protein